jgi:hypothetical protein
MKVVELGLSGLTISASGSTRTPDFCIGAWSSSDEGTTSSFSTSTCSICTNQFVSLFGHVLDTVRDLRRDPGRAELTSRPSLLYLANSREK